MDDDPLGNRRAQRHATSQLSAGNRLGKGEHHEDPALLILRRRQPFLQLQRDPPACAIEPFDDAALQIAVAVERVDGSGGDLQERVEESSRSEEHTSELQSLMRISYAVFCLKKKTAEDANRKTRTSR